MYSPRLPPDLTANRLTAAVEGMRRGGSAFVDLTLSNPTRAGFEYPDDMLAPLSKPAALVYEPSPLGLASARDAAAAEYARSGMDVPAERIVLTASTSDAYSAIFKLLA